MTTSSSAAALATAADTPIGIIYEVWPARDAVGRPADEPSGSVLDLAEARDLAADAGPWGGYVRRVTPSGEAWDYGAGFRPDAEDAAGAHYDCHQASVIIVTGNRADDVSGCCFYNFDAGGLIVLTDCGSEVPVSALDAHNGSLRIIARSLGAAHDRYAALEEVWETDPRYAPAEDVDHA